MNFQSRKTSAEPGQAQDDEPSVVGFRVDGEPAAHAAGEVAELAGRGRLSIGGDGAFSFQPVPGFSGPVPSVTYLLAMRTAAETAVLGIANVVPELAVAAPARWRGWLAPGMPFTFHCAGGDAAAAVTRIGACDGDQLTVYGVLTAPAPTVLPGMTGTATFQPPPGS